MQQIRLALLVAISILPVISSESLSPHKLSPKSIRDTSSIKPLNNENKIPDHIQESRLELVEPYKSLVQVTVRQVLTQANISNYVDTEYAMEIINEAGFKLSKPVTLVRVFEVVLAGGAAFFGAMYLYPKLPEHLEQLWRNPLNELNLQQYFPNGMNERTITGALSFGTEELLKKIGLKESACKRQVLCFLGDSAKNILPRMPERSARFMSNFKLGLADNQYVRAFMSGYVERDCSIINREAMSQNCLVKIIDNFLNQVKQFRSELVRQK